MANVGEQLKAELGYSPLLDSILLKFDKEILLATAQFQPLPLNDVFFTCYYIHGLRHLAGQEYNEHQHQDIVEIHHCLEGEYLYEIAGQPPLTLHSGKGVIIAPGLAHRTSCTEDGVRLTARAEINGPQKSACVHALIKQAAGRFIAFDGQDLTMSICKLFQALLEDGPSPWKYEIAGGLVRIWLARILATGFDFTCLALPPPVSSNDSNHGNALCERASSFIYANFQRPINLDEIAQHVGITARHLNRLFKQYVGISINQTLRDVRLTEAFRILSGGNTPSIKEVAYRTGFASPSYFTQCFKQQYGILPTEVNLRLSRPLKDALERVKFYR